MLAQEAKRLVEDKLEPGKLVPVEVAAFYMAGCGVEHDWAVHECQTMLESEEATAIPLEAFVQRMVVLAEMNPVAFDQLARIGEQTWLL